MRQLQSYSSLPTNPKERALSPLAKKLRLKPEHVLLVLNSPAGYLEFLEPGPATILTVVKPDGLLWIAYPTAGKSDLPATPAWNRSDLLGELTGQSGYKPIAFLKINETWT